MQKLISFYGDDFTGSTDTMEALASHGIKTALFTRIPSEVEYQSFANFMAIGVAGSSRSQSPDWMEQHLVAPFEWLKSVNARFCHYKVCSTFDSSPTTGSIGRAAEIGQRVFGQKSIAVIVGTPQLRRFTFAGHLFASYQDEVYRIDRHPVMSRHPITPMDEADLRIHLGKQTNLPVKLAKAALEESGLHLIDVFDSATQVAAGETMLSLPSMSLPFVIGASGVEYALVKALMHRGEIEGTAEFEPLHSVDRMVVVSGSVSPTTERQIRNAFASGFVGVEADTRKLADDGNRAELDKLLLEATRALEQGKSPIVYTALGPSTDRGKEIDATKGGRARLGKALGEIARTCIDRFKLKRVAIAGGDSSSHALGELDIYALTTRFPLKQTPGSPLCLVHSGNASLQGLEIAMKGGQLGGENYFATLRDGI
jgi:3-oxoisoapionate kinase